MLSRAFTICEFGDSFNFAGHTGVLSIDGTWSFYTSCNRFIKVSTLWFIDKRAYFCVFIFFVTSEEFFGLFFNSFFNWAFARGKANYFVHLASHARITYINTARALTVFSAYRRV